jgi:hypothetical protein
LNGTAEQAEDRGTARIRDVKSYFEIRRRTIGALPSFTILEMGMDLPDDVVEHPVIKALKALAVDMAIIANVGHRP